MIAKKESIIFLKKVFQLLIINASPKQPQSSTGFCKAMYKVSGVITDINNTPKIVELFLYNPIKTNTPNRNSNSINIRAKVNAKGIN